MRELIIAGTGSHAIEMLEIAERTGQWCVVGLIRRQDKAGPETLNGYPVLGGPEALARYPEAGVVPEVGPCPVPPDRLVTLIDPTCFVSRTATIGRGTVLYPHCFVGSHARIGERVFALSGAAINHDDVIEDDVVLASGAKVAGYVHVERGCYLGQSCTVRQSVRIGRDSMIGAGAVVLNDVETNSVMVGNPARRLRDRHPSPTP